MSREVMQQALESLKDCWSEHYQHTGKCVLDAITALETELAKPAPVAVPDKRVILPGDSVEDAYQAAGWNACREAMLAAAPQPPAPTVDVEAVREGFCPIEQEFCDAVTGALKGDHNDLRKEALILSAFRQAFSAASSTVDVEAVREGAKSDDLVTVPRELLGAACSAIKHNRAAPAVLAELRRYTTGDRSRAIGDET
jgi:hypothetical protein